MSDNNIIIDHFGSDLVKEERQRSFTVNSKLESMKSKIQVRRSEKQLNKFVPPLNEKEEMKVAVPQASSRQQQDQPS